MMTAWILGVAASLAILGNRLARRNDRLGRIMAGALLCGTGIGIGLLATSCLSAPYSPWDTVRLAAPMAAVRGFPLYAGRESGAVLSTMYGPIGMLAFTPAALASDPAIAAILGRLLAFLFAFGPLAATVVRGGTSTWRMSALVVASFAMMELPALRYSTMFLHADAPALGLMGLACLLIGSNRAGSRFAAAMACVLAVATKQTLLPLPMALLVAIALREGIRRAARWLLWLGVATGLVGVGLSLNINPDDLYLNVVRIPAGVPWKGHAPRNLLACSAELGLHAGPLLFLGAICWAIRSPGFSHVPEMRDAVSGIFSRPVRCADLLQKEEACCTCPTGLETTLILAALFLIPTAVLGRVKQAGDVNSFSPVLYPLLLAIAARMASIHVGLTRRPRIAMLTLLLAVIFSGSIRLNDEARTLARLRPFDAEAAYLRRHPGDIYLPWHPAAHLAAEGRPTHHLFTAWERGEAGFPVTHKHLLSALPLHCRFVAFPLKRLGPVAGFGSSFQMLERHGWRVDRDHPIRLAELPDYECFAVIR